MRYTLGAAVLLGVVSTAGDMLWEGLSLRSRVVSGVVHGALLCLLIGGLIGLRAGALWRGIAAGPVVGVLAAGVFYLLVSRLRYYAMFPAWMFFWICFAVLQKALAAEPSWGPALWRGLIAAAGSGLTFYAISGVWTNPPPGGPNYLYHFGAWTVAFLPGFAALFMGRR